MMKVIIRISLLFAIFVMLTAVTQAQSLGEAARKARKEKGTPSPAQKVYTNDNLPTTAPISVMSGPSTASTQPASGPEAESKKNGAPSAPSNGTGASDSADSKKDYDAWRSKIAAKKGQIALVERELEVMQREHQIQVSVFYADAGTRIRDDRKWADQERKYKSDMQTKQQAVATARQQLEDLREEARKAGVPASVTE